MTLNKDETSLSLRFFACNVEKTELTLQGCCDTLEKSLIQWFLLSTYYESGTVQKAGEQDNDPFPPHRVHMSGRERVKNQPACK